MKRFPFSFPRPCQAIICIALIIFACSSIPIKSVSDFKESQNIINEIKPQSEADKVRLAGIKQDLKECERLQKNYEQLEIAYSKLQKEYTSIAQNAGVGKFIYTFIYAALGIGLIILALKILKKFSIF
jgi:hypothetical protein